MNVVVIGGGNGSAISLRALKPHAQAYDIAAVISTSDSGGSSGLLRKEFSMIPPSDLMRACLALSPYEFDALWSIFYRTRFTDVGKLTSHNLGNLFLTLSAQYDGGNMIHALRAFEQALSVQGRVHPATLALHDLCIELSSGEVVRGEHAIDRPSYDRAKRIVRAFLVPEPQIYEEASRAVREADAIILGPGSLYTSIIAPLLVSGMREAIASSSAKIAYVAVKAYALDGETGPTRLSECVSELARYLPKPLDVVVYDKNPELTLEAQAQYAKKQWGVLLADPDSIKGSQAIGADITDAEGRADPSKLTSIFHNLIT